MSRRHSLRFRIVLWFMIYALITTLLFGFTVTILVRTVGSGFMKQRLQSELDEFTAQYVKDKRTPLPDSDEISVFIGTDGMPLQLREMIAGLSDGLHPMEDDRPWSGDWKRIKRSRKRSNFGVLERLEKDRDRHDCSYFMAIRTLPDGNRVYMFMNLSSWERYESHLKSHLSWSLIVVGIIGIILGLLTSNRVVAQLKKLAVLLDESGPDNLPSGFSRLFRNDELGALARALERSLQRIKSFMTREQQFTRDASHELRTPVTVIKGALELLQMTPAYQEETVGRLVKRIERSAQDMESTIESLLWLAREETADAMKHPCQVLPVVESAMEQHRHLLAGKPVDMKLVAESESVIPAPAGVLGIAVSNLVRNACQFTTQGEITIRLKEDRVEISDTGIGIAEEDLDKVTEPNMRGRNSSGFGFGLDMVKRLCDRFGWRLEIESGTDRGTVARLIFSQEEK
ncbi:MAG: HAMP domain-containing histidine kinase [Proteobacteria bacterium]|nr:HAMP domain-containing histidine kinase [Pseudomonadota bacterium]